MAVDGAEDRPRLDPRLFEPAAQGFDCTGLRIFSAGNGNLAAGSFLVGLGDGKFDDHSFRGELQVGYLDARQLGAAEGARETDQRERPVTQAEHVFPAHANDAADVLRQQRGLAVLRSPDGPADSFQCLADAEVIGRGRRAREA